MESRRPICALAGRILRLYLNLGRPHRDRIPKGEAKTIWEKLGYEDQLLDTAEPFGLWVIESQTDIQKELPLDSCGLPVLFTDNQKPYKQRKVRILNGAHTSFVPMAYLCGYDIVLQAMKDR